MFARSLRATFSRRFMSTEVPDYPKVPSVFERTKSFVSRNRQGILNVKVSIAWEAKQKEFDELDNRHKKLSAAIVDEDWIKTVEKKVKSSKEPVLAGLISSRLEEWTVVQAVSGQAADGESKEVVPGTIKADGSDNKRQII